MSVLPLLKPYPTLALIFAPDTNALKVVSPPIFTVAECEIEADLLTESGELLGLVAVCEKSCFVECSFRFICCYICSNFWTCQRSYYTIIISTFYFDICNRRNPKY